MNFLALQAGELSFTRGIPTEAELLLVIVDPVLPFWLASVKEHYVWISSFLITFRNCLLTAFKLLETFYLQVWQPWVSFSSFPIKENFNYKFKNLISFRISGKWVTRTLFLESYKWTKDTEKLK